jgi:hypothetical protein
MVQELCNCVSGSKGERDMSETIDSSQGIQLATNTTKGSCNTTIGLHGPEALFST